MDCATTDATQHFTKTRLGILFPLCTKPTSMMKCGQGVVCVEGDVKLGWKIPNRFGKFVASAQGGFFLTHTVDWNVATNALPLSQTSKPGVISGWFVASRTSLKKETAAFSSPTRCTSVRPVWSSLSWWWTVGNLHRTTMTNQYDWSTRPIMEWPGRWYWKVADLLVLVPATTGRPCTGLRSFHAGDELPLSYHSPPGLSCFYFINQLFIGALQLHET